MLTLGYASNLRIVDQRLPKIIKSLNELNHDDADAAQLRMSLMQFEIELLPLVIVYANEVSEFLQKFDIDVLNAFDRVSALKTTLQDCRSDIKSVPWPPSASVNIA
jgi:hypothetical protein